MQANVLSFESAKARKPSTPWNPWKDGIDGLCRMFAVAHVVALPADHYKPHPQA